MKRLLVTFFGTGYAPGAPGTAASLLMAALGWGYFHWFDAADPWPLVPLVVAMTFAGIGLGRWATAHFRDSDPGPFVLDEAAGQCLALVAAAPALSDRFPLWINVAAAFALFRFFDILKPPPIRQAERLPGGWGIMADDLVAGVASAAIVWAANQWIPIACPLMSGAG